MAVDKKSQVKEQTFSWEGKDKTGKTIKGEMRAGGDAVVRASLRRQGVTVLKIKKQSRSMGKRITEKDITFFTRQMAVMMKSGVPLLQAFDIVAKGHANPSVTRLLTEIKNDVETGASLTQAFRKHPLYFDQLFCNLIQAGEQAGILDALLDRLATYKEKILAIKGKIKSALFYPISILVAAFIVITVIMIFVIPAFKDLFSNFGAELPGPTQLVINISEIFLAYWWAIFGAIGGSIYGIIQLKKRSRKFQQFIDRTSLKLPVLGDVMRKATIARWTRTMSTMFAAGVPLVEALDSVGGAAGNIIYADATKRIQTEVSTGTSLTVAMQNSEVFPPMVMQMVAIGEESGALDAMLGKIADFFEQEVDEAVDALTSLMEPMIMMVLGPIIGGIIIAMYLPIFKMGAAVGG
ncbi:type II secretion system F family protein [Chitinimonas viridis]|uniref:Type II secretion system F family protein n=1 Tax=Chitinimonas viridis TaxID=664880 RepID=A0ABT8B499_9NEIS|nr:type II secretion system F family protein [Chitinimonas viridis]MDN3576814.1 type II secretion system F family protein [Chitinimonas viridis]